MNYPIDLISSYMGGEISREEFCIKYAELQGYDGRIRGTADKNGVYAIYRGRKAKFNSSFLTWQENGKTYTAGSLKELKIRIDTNELRKAAGF